MALTEVEDLIARLERDPENDVLAAMLCDELMDARGMYKFEAMSHVRNLQTAARDAIDIAHVAKVIRANGPLYLHLVERVRRSLQQPAGSAFVLFLISGDDKPRIGVMLHDLAADDPGPGLYVTLPCGWARAELSRSILPMRWPGAPKRVANRWKAKPPVFRVAKRCLRSS